MVCSMRFSFRRLQPWLLCVLVLLGAGGRAGAQEIYKWVDAQGVTQYSTTPPPPGVAAKVVRVAPAPPAEVASQARADAQRVIDETNRRAAERAEAQAQRAAQEAAQRRGATDKLRACANAREQLDVLMRGGPVFHYNERGERVYLDDSARDGEIARLRGEVTAQCVGSDATPAEQDAATRQRMGDAARLTQCRAAQDAARDLEGGGPRIPQTDIEQARERARRLCAGVM